MDNPSSSILIVDDEEALREAIAFDFRRKKFAVHTAASGNEAFELLEKTSIDLVISDVRMPNGSGIELLEKVKARDPCTPVVMFITGYSDISLEEAYALGADAVFAKPFDRKLLYEAVLSALQPPEARYRRRSSRANSELPVGLKFASGLGHENAKVVNLGRGGMFVAHGSPMPTVNERVDYRLLADAKQSTWIEGSGIVRWIREGGSEQTGCGIEFAEIAPESLKTFIELVNFHKTKSFIPRF